MNIIIIISSIQDFGNFVNLRQGFFFSGSALQTARALLRKAFYVFLMNGVRVSIFSKMASAYPSALPGRIGNFADSKSLVSDGLSIVLFNFFSKYDSYDGITGFIFFAQNIFLSPLCGYILGRICVVFIGKLVNHFLFFSFFLLHGEYFNSRLRRYDII